MCEDLAANVKVSNIIAFYLAIKFPHYISFAEC